MNENTTAYFHDKPPCPLWGTQQWMKKSRHFFKIRSKNKIETKIGSW